MLIPMSMHPILRLHYKVEKTIIGEVTTDIINKTNNIYPNSTAEKGFYSRNVSYQDCIVTRMYVADNVPCLNQ